MPETSSPIYINTPQESRPGRIIFILAVICLLSIASSIYLFYSLKKASDPGELVLSLDEAIVQSNWIIEQANQRILSSIHRQARAHEDEQGQETLAKAKEAKRATEEFVAYVESLKTELIRIAQNSVSEGSKPVGFMEASSMASRLMVGTENEPGRGHELMGMIRETREKLALLAGDAPSVSFSMPLKAEQEAVKRPGGKDWVEHHFKEVPWGAMAALLAKFQNDAEVSATITLNHLLSKIAGESVSFDAFVPAVSATRSLVLPGKKFNADIFLSAYSTAADENTKVYVDGNNLPLKNGKAAYETSAGPVGTKYFTVRIEAANPMTGQVELYEKEFGYEVSERGAAISAEKMNVFYIGVDNPLAISVAGVSSNDLSVSISGGGGAIRGSGPSYTVTVSTPGECRVNVSGGGLRDSKVFRVKRIPDPVARLGKSSGGIMSGGEFKAQGGVSAFLDNFDFDATCSIQGYKLTYASPGQEAAESANAGARYNEYSRRLVNMAKPGDVYYFDNVKALCPGDNMGRPINSMVFKIQ